MRLFIPSALAIVTLFFASDFAMAQNTLGKLPIKPIPIIVPQITISEMNTLGKAGFFSLQQAGKMDRTLALSTFKFHFRNSDHKISGIGLLPFDGMYHTLFRDINGDDDYEMRGEFWRIEGAKVAQTFLKKGYSPNPVNLRNESGFVDVLSGFEFEKTLGDDCKILEVFAGSGTSGEINGGFSGSCTPDTRIVTFSKIPQAAVLREVSITGNGPLKANAIGDLPNGQKYAIKSFKIRFENGDHFLRNFGINLNANDGKIVTFEDNDGNDPISFTIDYVILR